jgi:hypothetical protein
MRPARGDAALVIRKPCGCRNVVRAGGNPKVAREKTLKAGRSRELFCRWRVKPLAIPERSGSGTTLQGRSKPERGASLARDQEPGARWIPTDNAVGVDL